MELTVVPWLFLAVPTHCTLHGPVASMFGDNIFISADDLTIRGIVQSKRKAECSKRLVESNPCGEFPSTDSVYNVWLNTTAEAIVDQTAVIQGSVICVCATNLTVTGTVQSKYSNARHFLYGHCKLIPTFDTVNLDVKQKMAPAKVARDPLAKGPQEVVQVSNSRASQQFSLILILLLCVIATRSRWSRWRWMHRWLYGQ